MKKQNSNGIKDDIRSDPKKKNVIKIKIKTKLIMAPSKSTHPFFSLLGYNFSLDQSFVLSLKKGNNPG